MYPINHKIPCIPTKSVASPQTPSSGDVLVNSPRLQVDCPILEQASGKKERIVAMPSGSKAISDQDKKDEAWIAIAIDPNNPIPLRILAARSISETSRLSELNCSKINEAFLNVAKHTRLSFDDMREMSKCMSSLDVRNQFYVEVCCSTDQTIEVRLGCLDYIWELDAADRNRVEASLLSIIEMPDLKDKDILKVACSIEWMLNQETKDKAWMAIALQGNRDIKARLYAANEIKDIDFEIMDKLFISLYNDALSLEATEETLNTIIGKIEDADLQALARENLPNRIPVELKPTKSARKTSDEA